MKIWTKIILKEKNRDIDIISNSLLHYLKKDGPLVEICSKYNIDQTDLKKLESYTVNRIGGLLLLYFSKDKKRINDIINRYTSSEKYDVTPELEGYVEK